MSLIIDPTQKHKSEGPSGPSGSFGIALVSMLQTMTKTLSAYDPGAMTPEELTAGLLEFIRALKPILTEGGEESYMGKQSAVFTIEMLSLALHNNRAQDEIPMEQAALLDETLKKIRSSRAGVKLSPDVAALERVDSKEEFMNEAIRNSGFFQTAKQPAQ